MLTAGVRVLDERAANHVLGVGVPGAESWRPVDDRGDRIEVVTTVLTSASKASRC
jgi:hypothetical protein